MSPGTSSSLSSRSMASVPLRHACEQFRLQIRAVRLARFDLSAQFVGFYFSLPQVFVYLVLMAPIIGNSAMHVRQTQRVELADDLLRRDAVQVIGKQHVESNARRPDA